MTSAVALSPVVKYHGLGLRCVMPPRFLMRPLLNGGTLGGRNVEPSILTILALIQKRPSMYLGWDETARRRQLQALQSVITGYALALDQHGVGNDDMAVLAELEEFLRKRSGADNFSGIDQLLSTSKTEQEAWDRVWSLIDEFRHLKGHSI